MTNKVTINDKNYKLDKIKKIDFNAMCELEDLGLSISSISKCSLTSIRALLAFASGITVDEAGAEVQSHLKNGGSFDDCIPLINAFMESDFFQAIRPEEQTVETQVTTCKSTIR